MVGASAAREEIPGEDMETKDGTQILKYFVHHVNGSLTAVTGYHCRLLSGALTQLFYKN